MSESIHCGRSSAEVVQQIFFKLPNGLSVFDMTYGTGTFWKWDHEERVDLTTNDLFVFTKATKYPHNQYDFTDLPLKDDVWEVAVFDPPFTAQGPNKKAEERHNDPYGATRDLPGAPQNIHDVHRLLKSGIKEACRIARDYVVVKTQDVVESGELHGSVTLAMNTIVKSGFNIIETIRFFPPRRPQPAGRRVTGLGSQPSVFIIAERN